MSDGDTVLWANPPFAALDKVAEKLTFEKCRVALVTPDWEDHDWWKVLEKLPHQKILLPTRTPLYYGGFRKKPLPPVKNWRTVVWLIDTRGLKRTSNPKEKKSHRGLEELKAEVAKLPAVQWTHGFQGGKPAIKGAPHQPFLGTQRCSTRERQTQTELCAKEWESTNSSCPEEDPIDDEENLPRTPLATFRGGVKTFEEATRKPAQPGLWRRS